VIRFQAMFCRSLNIACGPHSSAAANDSSFVKRFSLLQKNKLLYARFTLHFFHLNILSEY
jgi:hypothetical protein